MEKRTFSVGETVCVGSSGLRGKITYISKPMGTYEIYTVRLFSDGTFIRAARHELVKGLDDSEFGGEFRQQFCFSAQRPNYSISEYEREKELRESQIDPIQISTSSKSTSQESSQQIMQDLTNLPEKRFQPINLDDVDKFIEDSENQNTRRKTVANINLLEKFFANENENRLIYQIPPEELNIILSKFFLSVRKADGTEYQPSSLRDMLGSFERYLKRHNYGTSLITSYEFSKCREVLKDKQKNLKKQGLGNKPCKADPITDDEINMLYECNQLGLDNPNSVLNTLWLNNSLHFGIRAGGEEHRSLCWGDFCLGFDSESKSEYIEFNERQTKTRTGENIRNTRDSNPRMYATGIPGRCPVELYKFYNSKRPAHLCNPNDPFYLATVTHEKNPGPRSNWFISGPVGQNKLKSIMKRMSQSANLPDLEFKKLKNTSVRKHLCQKLLEHDVPDTHAIHITGHKNPNSLNNYRTLNNKRKFEISSILSDTGLGNHGQNQKFITNNNTISTAMKQTSVSGDRENVNDPVSKSLSNVFSQCTIPGATFNITLNYNHDNGNKCTEKTKKRRIIYSDSDSE